jgi:two-component sensor histidine kinase
MVFKEHILFLLLCCCLSSSIIGQSPSISELKEQLAIEQEEYNRGKLYLDIASRYQNQNPEMAQLYLDSAKMQKSYAEDGRIKYIISFRQANILGTKGRLDDALAVYDSILQIPQVASDTSLLSELHFKIGDMYRKKRMFDKAIEAFNISKNYALEQGDLLDVAKTNVSIGVIFKNLGKYEEAIKIYTEAKEAFLKAEKWDPAATCILNTANLISRQGNHDGAIKMYEEAISIGEKLEENTDLMSYIYNNMSNAYSQKEDYKNALKYSLMNYPLMKKIGNPVNIATVSLGLGQNYTKLGDRKNGLKYYNEGLELAIDKGLIREQNRLSEALVYFHMEDGNKKALNEAFKLYKSTRDSLQARTIDRNIIEINTKYDTERKENEIAMLNKENEINALKLSNSRKQMYSLLAALLLFGFLLYRFYKLNGKLNKALEAKNILLQEIHHRVKNNLQVISSLLGLQSRYVKDEGVLDAIKAGRGRVQSMSLLHQNLYREENLKGVKMKDYFSNLAQNLFDTYNIDEENISFSSDVDDLELDIDTVVPLGLITNELITNSLKHAFTNGEKGIIHLSLKEAKGILTLSVSDNGKGLEGGILPIKNKSLGTKLIQSFAEKLDAEINVKSKDGTEVSLTVKDYKKAS